MRFRGAGVRACWAGVRVRRPAGRTRRACVGRGAGARRRCAGAEAGRADAADPRGTGCGCAAGVRVSPGRGGREELHPASRSVPLVDEGAWRAPGVRLRGAGVRVRGAGVRVRRPAGRTRRTRVGRGAGARRKGAGEPGPRGAEAGRSCTP
ncbi:hypothetical protein GCM10025780_26270 [Frondihabitans cladoniiphilus]|uniref:Uncharacterized protein n=1 Tax=Frondihabitans cladoniiphilus TaxID=715785 RepID=A0ABP8W4N5_9MICO